MKTWATSGIINGFTYTNSVDKNPGDHDETKKQLPTWMGDKI